MSALGQFGPISRRNAIATIRSASARISTALGILVERFFNKIKQCRRVATRYDKLAANYLAFIQLASIRLWLRVNESMP
jgi:transposase